MAEDDMAKASANFGLQFSISGAIIMFLLYLVQITETASFFLTPNATLTVALVAALGALMFYYNKNQSS